MLVMARDSDYAELSERLRGHRVLVWTCNTCARLCNGIGGDEAAGRLAERLREDGIEVTGVISTSASCIASKVDRKYDEGIIGGADVVLSLTCDVGSSCAGTVFGKPVVNPIETLGTGYMDLNGVPLLADGRVVFKDSDPFI